MISRRNFFLLIGTTGLSFHPGSSWFTPSVLAADSLVRPKPEDLQTGDLLWPQHPNAYIPFSSGQNLLKYAERKWWIDLVTKFSTHLVDKSTEQAWENLQAVKDSVLRLQNSSFSLFYSRYAKNQSVADATPKSTLPQLAVGHVGIVLAKKNIPYIVDADLPSKTREGGVRSLPYEDWLNVSKRQSDNIWHASLKLRDNEKQRVAEIANDQIGAPYNFCNWDLLDGSGFYCSKLIWYSYYQATQRSMDGGSARRSFWFSPKMLMNSKDSIVYRNF